MALTLEVGTAYDYPTIEDAAAALGLTLTSGRDWSSLDGTIPGMVVDNALTGTPTTPGVYTVTAREVSIYGDYYTKTADVTVNGPEPEPEPAGSTLVPDVLEFLGLPDNPDMTRLATQHVRIVTTFVRNYTRGNGFDAEGIPNADLHDVIITATARYLPNPQQATRQSLGNQSIGYATIEGFTLTEKAVLNRYRKMTSRGNIVTTTSTGTGGTTTYATVDYVDAKVAGVPTTDLDGYATTSYVDDVARSLKVDLNPYATRSYVDVAIDRIPDVDLTPYALKTELPAPVDLTGYATESYVDQAAPDLTPYALKSAVPGLTVDRSSGVRVTLSNPGGNVMLYGFTGRRNVSDMRLSGTGGLFVLYRVGSTVHFEIAGWATGSAGYNPVINIPAGFKPGTSGYIMGLHGGTRTLRTFHAGSSTLDLNNAASVGESYSTRLQWETADPWPTTLPGVAA